MTGQGNRRRYLLLSALLAVLLLAWWQFAGKQESTEGKRSGALKPAVATQPAFESPESPEIAMDEIQVDDESEDISALDQYKEITRYPSSTRRLKPDSHDLLNPGARHESRSKLPGEQSNPDLKWEVLFTADRYFVRDTEPLLITLQLWNAGEAVLPGHVSMKAVAVDGDDTLKPARLKIQTDGKAISAEFTPNDFWPDYVGQVRVSSGFSASGLSAQEGTLDFFFTGAGRIPARFNGQFTDRLAAGDLLIDLGLNVIHPGIFRIEGNLFDVDGQPFGWARFEGELQAGQVVATLQFYGLLFHDADAAGPYILRGLRGYRLRPGDVPGREDIPDYPGDYVTTGQYELNAFRSDINNSPRRQKMIELYEDAERRGVKLTRPEYTGDQ